jgi:branched-chain amino acid transport system permease protein
MSGSQVSGNAVSGNAVSGNAVSGNAVSDGPAPGGAIAAIISWRTAGILVIAAALAFFPLVFTNGLADTIGVDAVIFVSAAAAWNIFSGYSGYISLGHAVFFGTGAYTVAIGARDWHLTGDAVFALLPLAAAVAAAVAVPLGLVALRVRRHTFVVVTIAFFFIFQLMAFNFSFTAGSTGIIAPVLNWQPTTYDNPFYYTALGIAAATTALAWLIRGSRFGLQLRAIRDDEDRARGLGVRAMRVKLAALVISAFITGLVGGLWFYFIGEALPQFAFDPIFDLSVALMAFLGGLGTVAGPVLGALIIESAQQYLTTTISNDYLSEILLGALFLAVILLLPRGVIPTASEKISQWRARRHAAADSAAATAAPGSARPPGPAGSAGPTGSATVGAAGKAAADEDPP